MQSFKSKIFLVALLFSVSTSLFAMFNDMECVNSSYVTTVTHKGKPFGFADNVLNIEKNGCMITISHSKIKFMNTKWIIDVCRGPVHLKMGNQSIEVIKRTSACGDNEKGEYCRNYQKLEEILQDDGLIFATGDKEDLSSPHGQIFCSYLLLKKYLEYGLIFSKEGNYNGILRDGLPLTPIFPVTPGATPTATANQPAAVVPQKTGSF